MMMATSNSYGCSSNVSAHNLAPVTAVVHLAMIDEGPAEVIAMVRAALELLGAA
jgi:hypothetical protein